MKHMSAISCWQRKSSNGERCRTTERMFESKTKGVRREHVCHAWCLEHLETWRNNQLQVVVEVKLIPTKKNSILELSDMLTVNTRGGKPLYDLRLFGRTVELRRSLLSVQHRAFFPRSITVICCCTLTTFSPFQQAGGWIHAGYFSQVRLH